MKYVPITNADQLIGDVILAPKMNPVPMLLIDIDFESDTLYAYDIYGDNEIPYDLTAFDETDNERCVRVPTSQDEFNSFFQNITLDDADGVSVETRRTRDTESNVVMKKEIQVRPPSLHYIDVRIRNGEIDMINRSFEHLIEKAVDQDVLSTLNAGRIDSIATIGFKNDTIYWCEQMNPFFDTDIRDVCIEHGVWGYGIPTE